MNLYLHCANAPASCIGKQEHHFWYTYMKHRPVHNTYHIIFVQCVYICTAFINCYTICVYIAYIIHSLILF